MVPESQFKGGENSAWLVRIDPVWKSDQWYGNTAKSVAVFNSLKAEHNYKDLRTLLDDTSLYGPDCGWTNPNGTPQPIPTNGKAVFSRGLIHTGPCEIWLDNKKVLAADDCYSKYGHSNVNVKTEFPVDYSSCKNGGLVGIPGPRQEDRVADVQGLHPTEGGKLIDVDVVVNPKAWGHGLYHV
ncbi:Mucin-like protein 2 [Phytophthora cinnamomi]|uniref:Mucin-like protein 2 n=1 Tax=Phytophthora cinnamomi TaxID=4785 RepID=UPI00355A0DF0|nr:Mucin-like protein 2 [Phytophthora cinnamomi]